MLTDKKGLVYEKPGMLLMDIEKTMIDDGFYREIPELRPIWFGEEEVKRFVEMIGEMMKEKKKEKKIKPMKVSFVVPEAVVELVASGLGKERVEVMKEEVIEYIMVMIKP